MKQIVQHLLLPLIPALLLSPTLQAEPFRLLPSATLEKLAEDARSERQLAGGILLASGGATFVVGMRVAEDLRADGEEQKAYDSETAFNLVGSALVFGGAMSLVFRSRTEKAWERISFVADDTQRENQAYSEIFNLASEQKTKRMLSGLANIGLAAWFLAREPYAKAAEECDDDEINEHADEYNAVMLAASGLAKLMVPTKVERALAKLDQQQRNRDFYSSLEWGVGLDRHASPQLAFNYSF